MAEEISLRLLEAGDLPAVAELSAEAFGVAGRGPEALERWARRVAEPLSTDPNGCFVAERDGVIIGAAQALRRERLWCLSLLAVQPGLQGVGAGHRLFDRALEYGAGCEHGLILASDDPRARRLYAQAGFRLRPTFRAAGTLDRTSLPPPSSEIREGGKADLAWLEAISREVRGAPHTAELRFALERGGRLLCVQDRGFVVVLPGEGVWLLAAADEQTATVLLWGALRTLEDGGRWVLRWATQEQRWALDIAVRAGLRLIPYGALCVRGAPGRLYPFIPSPPFV